MPLFGFKLSSVLKRSAASPCEYSLTESLLPRDISLLVDPTRLAESTASYHRIMSQYYNVDLDAERTSPRIPATPRGIFGTTCTPNNLPARPHSCTVQ